MKVVDSSSGQVTIQADMSDEWHISQEFMEFHLPVDEKELQIGKVELPDAHEYVDPNTQIIVAAAVDTAGTATADTTMNFTVNNSEFSKDASVSALVTGEPFGWKGSYVMNDTIVTGAIRNRPVITFTNNTSATRTIDVAVFLSSQP